MKSLHFYILWASYAFLDPDPDPATQINVGPCWSESKNLTFMLCLFKNQLCLFPNEKIVLSINHWCFCSQPIWTIFFFMWKNNQKTEEVLNMLGAKNFLGLSAEVLYQLCCNGSIEILMTTKAFCSVSYLFSGLLREIKFRNYSQPFRLAGTTHMRCPKALQCLNTIIFHNFFIYFLIIISCSRTFVRKHVTFFQKFH